MQVANSDKLHIGCGTAILTGWTNIDLLRLPGVDVVMDVRDGLPYTDARFIFAEHFIEHLDFHSGLEFLRQCRNALRTDGVLRLSTPNLDWVWLNQYHVGSWATDGEAVRDCFWMNKAFRGWGHQFLYNRQTLKQVLIEAGFRDIETASYGKSRHPELRGLERHEQYDDSPQTPHVVVLEASGVSQKRSDLLIEPRADFESAVES